MENDELAKLAKLLTRRQKALKLELDAALFPHGRQFYAEELDRMIESMMPADISRATSPFWRNKSYK